MKNIVNNILLSAMVALAVAGSAAASSVSYNNVFGAIRNTANFVDVAYGRCHDPVISQFGINPTICPGNVDHPFDNTTWGYGAVNFSAKVNGTISLKDGVPVTIDPQQPTPTSNILYFDVAANSNHPQEPNSPDSFSAIVVPTCIHVEQDNQGVKTAVVRGMFRFPFLPGFQVNSMMVSKQNANGQDSIVVSVGVLGTGCSVSDAQNAAIDTSILPSYCASLPLITSDNLFNLLNPITSGNITLKK